MEPVRHHADQEINKPAKLKVERKTSKIKKEKVGFRAASSRSDSIIYFWFLYCTYVVHFVFKLHFD